MTPSHPKKFISTLIPVYNSERYLREAIDSVLNQSYPHFEIIIVNDGSTDKSLNILNAYNDSRIKIYTISNSGITKALNFGLKQCKYDIIARMDADDICHQDRFAKQINKLIETEADIVWSNAMLIDDDGQEICPRHQPSESQTIRLLKDSNFIIHPASMYRKAIIEKVGGYNETFKTGQDWQLWKELQRNNAKFSLVDEMLLKYRISNSSISFANFLQSNDPNYRNAQTCLKNRQRDKFWSFWKKIATFRARAKLLVRYILGESVILYARIILQRLRLRKSK